MKDILDLVAFSNLFIFSVSTSAVFLSFAPFGILDLHTEFSNSAISLDLGRVPADNFDNPSCSRRYLVWSLGPRIHRNGGGHQDRNNQLRVHGRLFSRCDDAA
ncbi:MAG: hypothetical protein WAK36_21250 [Pseudolabrys sp.]